MITPNKYIPFERSIIFKMLSLIKSKEESVSITDLYRDHQDEFDGIDEFMFSLDVLYVLDKIEIDFETGTLVYAH